MATTDPDELNSNQSADADEIALLSEQPEKDPPDKPTEQEQPASSEPSNEDHDDDGDDDATARRDTELDEAADEAAREAIRARRREERKNRKERGREKLDGLERQVRALAEQNRLLQDQQNALQSHNHGSQLAQLDHHISQHQNAVTHFEALLADSTTKGDGDGVVNAMRARDEARDKLRDLQGLKARVTSQRAPAPQVDPVLVSHVRTFIDNHKWYGGPDSKDMDSRMLKVIDDSVAADGFDPRTQAYYDELEKRGRERLPHRFPAASGPAAPPAGERRPPRSPVGGAGGDGGKAGGGENYQLSAERVKAMKESGAWDDPKRRAKMIRDYQDFDKRNKA